MYDHTEHDMTRDGIKTSVIVRQKNFTFFAMRVDKHP